MRALYPSNPIVALPLMIVAMAAGFYAWNRGQSEGGSNFKRGFSAPITFYGKVIDQYGAPVTGAEVLIKVNNSAWGNSHPYPKVSDSEGEFSITGVNGLNIYVDVRRSGCRRVLSKDGRSGSAIGFAYGTDLGYGLHRPDPKNPALFLLHRIGVVEKLVHLRENRYEINKDGVIRRIGIDGAKTPKYQVEVSCRTEEEGVKLHESYRWRLRIAAPSGMLSVRDDEFDFLAPTDGYLNEYVFDMPKDPVDGKWTSKLKNSFFVRFDDGVHARIDVRMSAANNQAIVIQSWLNPRAGSRNLEDYPEKK